MAQTANSLVDMIQKRMAKRIAVLNSINISAMDIGLPVEIKNMREMEAARLRAVIEEQSDLIEVIRMLYPNTSTNLLDDAKS